MKDLNKVSKKKRFSTKPTVTVELNPLTERKQPTKIDNLHAEHFQAEHLQPAKSERGEQPSYSERRLLAGDDDDGKNDAPYTDKKENFLPELGTRNSIMNVVSQFETLDIVSKHQEQAEEDAGEEEKRDSSVQGSSVNL